MALAGITAKNDEQKQAIEAMCNKEVQLVVLTGEAGCGKSLLACAYAIDQVYAKQKRVVITKPIIAIGKDPGALPGGVKDKFLPWLGSFADNLDVLDIDLEGLIENEVLEIIPIAMVQGRSIRNATVIIDECQNLPLPILKQLITRIGEGSKVILLGDMKQVFLRGDESGLGKLVHVIEQHPCELVAHVHLKQTLRSPIVSWAIEHL